MKANKRNKISMLDSEGKAVVYRYFSNRIFLPATLFSLVPFIVQIISAEKFGVWENITLSVCLCLSISNLITMIVFDVKYNGLTRQMYQKKYNTDKNINDVFDEFIEPKYNSYLTYLAKVKLNPIIMSVCLLLAIVVSIPGGLPQIVTGIAATSVPIIGTIVGIVQAVKSIPPKYF